MTMLAVGCSWTWGTGVEANETFSAHLQDYSGKKVINAGHAGTDIQYSIWSVYRLVEEFKPNVVIFQLTTLDRMTLGASGKRGFLKQQYHDGIASKIYSNGDEYVRLNGIGDSKKELLTVGSYAEALEEKTERNIAFKYLTENIMYDNYTTETVSMQLYFLQDYLKNKGIYSLFFSWLPWPQEFYNTYQSIKISDRSAIEFLGDNYYVDNGFHISSEGHKKLAIEYIYPQLVMEIL